MKVVKYTFLENFKYEETNISETGSQQTIFDIIPVSIIEAEFIHN